MYYLNNEHYDYEYAIYCQKSKGCPYILGTKFYNLDQAKNFLIEVGDRHNKYKQIYYIDNSFYSNIYPKDLEGFYYKILKRKINDWKEIA